MTSPGKDITVAEQAALMARLAARALPAWGLPADAALTLVGYRENAVFRVDTGAASYALKVHRQGYHSDAELVSELQWIRALEQAGLRVPAFVPACNGEPFARVEHDDLPGVHQVDLSHWVNGRELGNMLDGSQPDRDTLLSAMEIIGATAARIHNQSSTWSPPPGFRRFAWDADGFTGAAPLWGRFWEIDEADGGQRALLAAARQRLRERLQAFGTGADRFGLIHADLCAENVMRVGEEFMVIDFDDAGFGWHAYDLATSLYFHRVEPGPADFDALLAAWLAGYRRHRAFKAEQLAMLEDFLLARGLTVLAWCHTRRETETSRNFLRPCLAQVCALAAPWLDRTA